MSTVPPNPPIPSAAEDAGGPFGWLTRRYPRFVQGLARRLVYPGEYPDDAADSVVEKVRQRYFGRPSQSEEAPATSGGVPPGPPGPSSLWPPGIGVLQPEADVASPVLPARPSVTRAVRLPNGRVVFTNQAETYAGEGGREVPLQEATAEFRRRTAAAPSPAPFSLSAPGGYPEPGGTRERMRALVRAAAESTTPGGLSVIEGTPEQQRALRLEDVVGQTDLAEAEQELQAARMSPADRARVENKEIQTVQYLLTAMEPRLQEAEDLAREKVRQISTPDELRYIKDEKAREKARQDIEDELHDRTRSLETLAGIAMGLRPVR